MPLGDFPIRPYQEFPHVCDWLKAETDLENPQHQKELLRGKQLYECPELICRKQIWLKHKPKTYMGMRELWITSINEATRDLDWDKLKLNMRTWDHILLDTDTDEE